MALRTSQALAADGLAPTYFAASAGGDKVDTGPHVFIHVKNANAAACTVTIVTPGTVDGLAIADRAVVVPATTGDRMIGPIDTTYRNIDGQADITWSITASVTFAAVRT